MKFRLAVLLLSLGFSASLLAVDWVNLDEDHYVAGRKCSSGYLRGKVVLVCQDDSLAARMEEIWTSFKMKPFVLIGTFDKAPKGGSFPVYAQAGMEGKTSTKAVYVVDQIGRVRYVGADERRATEAVVTLLTDLESPKTEAQYRQFLDYEIENLPGQACLRYLDFKKRHPASAKDYAARCEALGKDADVKKLVELVKLARAVKDIRTFDAKKERLQKSRLQTKIKEALAKYASLKESENPLVVQEAKNALADLAWAKAAL